MRGQKQAKESSMNRSFESTISEPTRLSVYRGKQKGEIPYQLKALIRKKLVQKKGEERN
jgi:hypothetical protein